MAYYTTEDVMQAIADKLTANMVALGLKAIYYGDNNNIAAFPGAMVAGAPLNRELHATRQFKLTFTVFIYVIDAKLSQTKSARIKVDMQEATAIANLIHQDLTLGGNLIFGWISQEEPGVLATGLGRAVVGTRLTYTGEQLKGF